MRLPDPGFWADKRVLLTGHTGFKGSWFTLWLADLGARVRGYALAPDTSPSIFDALALQEICEHQIADVRDAAKLARAVGEFKPDVVFHFAAQPLVLRSYREPAETFDVNVRGTINLLQACQNSSARAIVVITTDKCYLNREWLWPYREDEPVGGNDPYSASKACAELVVHAWRESFFHQDATPVVASARAGNIFGGGDWSDNRIIPDAARAFNAGTPLVIRRPQAVRPWQHVTSPLAGYLLLAEHMCQEGHAFGTAFNFGPPAEDALTVRELVAAFVHAWGGEAQVVENPDPMALHEAGFLTLDSTRARHKLQWRPLGDLAAGLERTAAWYKAFYSGACAREMRALSIAALRNEPAQEQSFAGSVILPVR